MDPFAMALDALFEAPGSLSGHYSSPSLGTVPVRVVPRQSRGDVGIVRPRSVVTGAVFDLRTSEVASPLVGDVLVVDGIVRQLAFEPQIDAEGLTWACDFPELERVIRLERLELARDDHGDDAERFVLLATTPAARLDLGAREEAQAGNVDRQSSTWRRSVFLTPWTAQLAGLSEGDRLVDDGTVFSIESVAELGHRDGIEITAAARSS